MSSYLSNLVSSTTSRYTSLRRTLLPPSSTSESDDATITDPEDSHLSRVLRAYYTEKGPEWPPWLGEDPRTKKQQRPSSVGQTRSYSTSGSRNGSVGGSLRGSTDSGRATQGGSAGLGDLWADDVTTSQPPVQGSMRREDARGGSKARLGLGRNLNLNNARREGGQDQEQPRGTVGPRPLPSQRAGSYQISSAPPPMARQQGSYSSVGMGRRGESSYADGGGGGSGPSMGSVQDRLKARLGGQRVTPGNTPRGNPFDEGRYGDNSAG